MLFHFIKTDLMTNKLYLGLLAIFSVAAYLLTIYFPTDRNALLFFLMEGYFLFAIVKIIPLSGATMRTQYHLSRNYLLALPVERKHLFLLLHLRAAVFALPFLIGLFLAPFVSERFVECNPFVLDFYPSYVVMVVLQFLWLVDLIFSAEPEKYIHRPPFQRVVVALSNVMYVFVQTLILAASFALTIKSGNSPLIPLIAIGTLALMRFLSARKRWAG